MKTLSGLLQLTRPTNMLICFLTVVCGGILGGAPISRLGELVSSAAGSSQDTSAWTFRILIAAASASLILAAGNVYNDVRDIATDRINAPHRPLPSGRVSPLTATVYAAILALAGLLLSTALGYTGSGIAILAVILLFVYDLKLKGVPLAGNAVVAFLGGAAFVYGGIAGDAVAQSFLPASFAALFHLGRELIKDAADFEGDRSAGISTAATAWGIRPACRMAAGVLAALAVITILPAVTGVFGTGYLIIITVGVLPIITYSSILPFHDHSAPALQRIAILLKIDMPVGLIAVLAGFQGM